MGFLAPICLFFADVTYGFEAQSGANQCIECAGGGTDPCWGLGHDATFTIASQRSHEEKAQEDLRVLKFLKLLMILRTVSELSYT